MLRHTLLTAGSLIILLTPCRAQDHWEPTGGPTGGTANAVIVANEAVFAGTDNGGIFRSDDLGESWTRLDVTGAFESVREFVQTSDGTIFAATSFGVRRSTDGGVSWDLVSRGLPSVNLRAMAVTRSDSLFVGSFSGVFRSDHRGESWSDFSNGLTSSDVYALATGPDGMLYAGTTNGLFESPDTAAHWTEIGQGLDHPYVLSVHAMDAGLLLAGGFGGLQRRADATADWEQVDRRPVYDFDTTSTGALIAGATEVLLKSTDRGATWMQVVFEPRPFLVVYGLARTGTAVLAATANRGMFRSDDDAATWQIKNDGFDASDIRSLAFDGADGTLFVGTAQGVFRSSDQGSTWERTIDGLSRVNIEAVATTGTGLVMAGTNGNGLFISGDQGDNWTLGDSLFAFTGIRSFGEAPGGELYAGGAQGGVFRSVDNGASWDTVAAVFFQQSVEAIAIGSDGVIYAGGNSGVRRSTDGAATWEDFSDGLQPSPDVVDFHFLPDGGVLAAAFIGVYRLNAAGGAWELTGQLPIGGIRDLDQDSDGKLYVAVRGAGVYVSEDTGATWTGIRAGLNNLDAKSLTIAPGAGKTDGDQVYLGTRGGGVHRLVSVATSTEDDGPEAASGFNVGQNYPNPFSTSTTIPIELDESAEVLITVFDVLGRTVMRIPAGTMVPGLQQVTVDASRLAPGTYFYRVDAGNDSAVRAMKAYRGNR